ncbi:MAG: hypothetical protein II882_07120 [Lachnospiraceae bacterium]|nr:hypothetical protein [Lachnospiraceae bacterium]
MSQLTALSADAARLAAEHFTVNENTPNQFRQLQYPKLLPVMRFTIHRYALQGFGSLMTMDTVGMGGLMKLSTLVFTPGEGGCIPFLLVDTMEMKKKALAYAEFYDCTEKGCVSAALDALKDRYTALPDYEEKPEWYVPRRTPYSLIKGGEVIDPSALSLMITDALLTYLAEAAKAEKDPANLAGLCTFRNELCDKGNPASEALNKLFGKDGAKNFFKEMIMPIPAP